MENLPDTITIGNHQYYFFLYFKRGEWYGGWQRYHDYEEPTVGVKHWSNDLPTLLRKLEKEV